MFHQNSCVTLIWLRKVDDYASFICMDTLDNPYRLTNIEKLFQLLGWDLNRYFYFLVCH